MKQLAYASDAPATDIRESVERSIWSCSNCPHPARSNLRQHAGSAAFRPAEPIADERVVTAATTDADVRSRVDGSNTRRRRERTPLVLPIPARVQRPTARRGAAGESTRSARVHDAAAHGPRSFIETTTHLV